MNNPSSSLVSVTSERLCLLYIPWLRAIYQHRVPGSWNAGAPRDYPVDNPTVQMTKPRSVTREECQGGYFQKERSFSIYI